MDSKFTDYYFIPYHFLAVMDHFFKVQKGVKRKADTTTLFGEEAAAKIPTRRESGRPPKKPNYLLDNQPNQLKPRFKGKPTEQLKYCQRILNELFSKLSRFI